MSLYNRDIYGTIKYGSDTPVEFDVSPFTAVASGYSEVTLSWRSPTGDVSSFRLLKSKYGYATTEFDGDILIDTADPGITYLDKNVTPGRYYYYTVFVETPNGWFRAASAEALVLDWYGYADNLWEKIPTFYKNVPPISTLDSTSSTAQVLAVNYGGTENKVLKSFLRVLGFGFDSIHTYLDTAVDVNNASLTRLSNLKLLGEQLGLTYEYAVPSRITRKYVSNAAGLAAERGSLAGLRDLVAAATGWDVDLYLSNNFFPNKDMAEFYHPVIAAWDSAVNYPEGQQVFYNDNVYTANTGGAYGNDEKPPLSGSNAWWTTSTAGTSTEYTVNGALYQWSLTESGTPIDPQLSVVGSVITDSTDTTTSRNSLTFSNTTGTSKDYVLTGLSPVAGESDQYTVVTQGLQIPNYANWSVSHEYFRYDTVKYQGRLYVALRSSLGQSPDDFPNHWSYLNTDDRPPVAITAQGHAGDGVGVDYSATIALTQYDARGREVTFTHGNFDVDWVDGNYDTFNDVVGQVPTTRTPDVYSTADWTVTGDWWISSEEDNRTVAPAPTGTMLLPSPSWTRWRAGVTFAQAPLGTSTQALIVGWTDDTHFIAVARDGIYYANGGGLVLFSSLSIKDGDRVIVKVDFTTPNDLVVIINDVEQASVTLPVTVAGSYGIGVI